jgi:polysaccharide export outer membrane protein
MLFALAALAPIALPALADSSGPAFARGSSEPEFSAQGVTPPAVKSIQEARRSLAGLEDDRSRMGRRTGFMPGLGSAGSTSPTPGATPPATPSVGASLADSMRRGLDTITVSVTPHVNAATSTLIGSGGALQRRRTELQAEVARWGTAQKEWEARYEAAKAEVSRLESSNDAETRLDQARRELANVEAEIAKTTASAVSQVIPDPVASYAPTPIPTPVAASQDFSGVGFAAAVGSPRSAPGPAAPPISSANLAYQSQMAHVLDRQRGKQRELDGIQDTVRRFQRDRTSAERADQREELVQIDQQLQELNERYTVANSEMARIGAQMQSLESTANAANAASAAPARASMGGGDPNMVSAGTIPGINPGDTVEVSVLEDPSTGGTFLVNTSGAIDLPGIGTVQILGQSEAGAADLIRQKLEGAVLVTATVAVRHIPQLRETRIGLSSPPAAEVYSIIYLAGEFITPGPLRIPADVSPTLLQTIIRSGGITPSGDLTRVKLLRIGGEVSAMEEINVAGILSGQMPPNDVALAPNDIIVIPPFAPVVYVTGNVERAGTLRLFQDETLTAYAAILRAGGFSRFANLRKCYVVRDLGNGEKMQIPVNVREVQKGKFPDVILQGKDIVVVPERFFSF